MEEYYMMWLSRLEGIGPRRVKALLEIFGSAEEIWHTSLDTLCKVPHLPENVAHAVAYHRDKEQLDAWITELEEKNMEAFDLYKKCNSYALKLEDRIREEEKRRGDKKQ